MNIGYKAAQELCQSIINAGLVNGLIIAPSLRASNGIGAATQPAEPLDTWSIKHAADLEAADRLVAVAIQLRDSVALASRPGGLKKDGGK